MAYPYPRPYVHPLGKPTAVPVATGGKRQPDSARGPKLPKPRTVRVKAHTRTVAPRAPRAPQAPANPDQALINAAVRSRYGGQEAALGQQLQQNARFTSGLGDWYGNAMREIAALKAGQAAAAQQQLAQITAYNSQPTLPGNATDQQAATARNNLNAEFAAQQGQIAQANSGAMDRLQAAFLAQQGNTQNQANLARTQLLGAQGTLRGEEGDFRTTYGAQLAAQEQKAAADAAKTQLAADALGLKVNQYQNVQLPLAQSLAQNRAAQQRVSRTNARTQRERAREQARHEAASETLGQQRLALDQWKATHPPRTTKARSGPAAFTPTQIRSARAEFRHWVGTANTDGVRKDPKASKRMLILPKNLGHTPSGKPIYGGYGVDPLMADAVVQTIAYGGVDRKTATKFYRAFGFHLGVRQPYAANDLTPK